MWPKSIPPSSGSLKNEWAQADFLLRMLYDFYTVQNSNEPDAVHANYMLTGYRQEEDKKKVEGAEGEDTHMEASPFEATQQPDKALVRSIVVVPQEKLTGTTPITPSSSGTLTNLLTISRGKGEILKALEHPHLQSAVDQAHGTTYATPPPQPPPHNSFADESRIYTWSLLPPRRYWRVSKARKPKRWDGCTERSRTLKRR